MSGFKLYNNTLIETEYILIHLSYNNITRARRSAVIIELKLSRPQRQIIDVKCKKSH